MLDNLRDSASQSPFFQEDQTPLEPKDSRGRKRRSDGRFLGMSPAQRFMLALLLFLMVCVMGSFLLLVTEKIVPTIF
jgi:hypothetical protein